MKFLVNFSSTEYNCQNDLYNATSEQDVKIIYDSYFKNDPKYKLHKIVQLHDTHGALNYIPKSSITTTECICITFPVTGWYKIKGQNKELYFLAGDQLVMNGPYTPSFPKTGDSKESK